MLSPQTHSLHLLCCEIRLNLYSLTEILTVRIVYVNFIANYTRKGQRCWLAREAHPIVMYCVTQAK